MNDTYIEIEAIDSFEENVQEIIINAFAKRQTANEIQEKTDQLKEEANEEIRLALKLSGVKKIDSNIGTYREVSKSTSRLNGKALKNWLAQKGVDTDLLVEGWVFATTKGTSNYIGFFKPREKKVKKG